MPTIRQAGIVLAAALMLALPLATVDAATKTKKAAPPASAKPQVSDVIYDTAALPERVAAMRLAILEAARSGEVERLVPVLQSNELMPMLAKQRVEDPVAYLKQQSADGTGRDVLAMLIDVMESGYVKLNVGGTVSYVWPYFAEMPIEGLTPSQQVELYRIVPASEVKAMRDAGKYLHYSVGIGPDGTWHYFMKSR